MGREDADASRDIAAGRLAGGQEYGSAGFGRRKSGRSTARATRARGLASISLPNRQPRQKSHLVSRSRGGTKIVVRIPLFFVVILAAAVGDLSAQEAFNRLIFTGDVMLSRAVRRQILAAKDPALPFRKMAPMLAASDIAFVNLESPFSDKGTYHEGGMIFHA